MSQNEYPLMHTAEHILNQTMVRLFSCGRCITAHLGRKKSKCDYRLSRELTREEIDRVEEMVNKVIQADMTVYAENLSAEEAEKRLDLSGLPEPPQQGVRVVRVGDFDICPCIGKHAENTSELGSFRISSSDCQDGILRLRFKLERG